MLTNIVKRDGRYVKFNINKIAAAIEKAFSASEGTADKDKCFEMANCVKEYFENPEILVQAIKKYNEISKIRKGEYTLLDLLK